MIIKKNSAVIIVHAQNDFMNNKGSFFPQSFPDEIKMIGKHKNLVSNIVSFVNEFDNDKIFFIEDKHKKDSIEFGYSFVHCVENTFGQEIIKELMPIYQSTLFKHRIIKGLNSKLISYVVDTSEQFYDHVIDLKNYYIKYLYLVGCGYDYFIIESAIAYLKQGFTPILVRNLMNSYNQPSAAQAFQKSLIYQIESDYYS